MHVAGVSPLESWDWTGGEGLEIINAYMQRENDRAKKRAVALYNATVLLVHSLPSVLAGGEIKGFAESFPGFDVEQAAAGTMSDEAMYANVRALNAIFGGEEDG